MELAAQQTAAQPYERDSALGRITADIGWQTWTGVGGVLYARRPMNSPPLIVRAPSVQALREAIDEGQS